MNDWLEQNHSKLYAELDSLKVGHPSARDNGRWIAEILGKLDACTSLKDINIDTLRIDEIRKKFDGQPSSKVDQSHLQHYRDGAIEFIDSYTRKLRDG